MSFTLTRSDGHAITFNAWTWKPITALLINAQLIDGETFELLQYNLGTELSGAQVGSIAVFLDRYVSSLSTSTVRILNDLTESDTEDDGTFFRDPAQLHRNYSASVESLRQFRDFC